MRKANDWLYTKERHCFKESLDHHQSMRLEEPSAERHWNSGGTKRMLENLDCARHSLSDPFIWQEELWPMVLCTCVINAKFIHALFSGWVNKIQKDLVICGQKQYWVNQELVKHIFQTQQSRASKKNFFLVRNYQKLIFNILENWNSITIKLLLDFLTFIFKVTFAFIFNYIWVSRKKK
jgi:hypothetical protein